MEEVSFKHEDNTESPFSEAAYTWIPVACMCTHRNHKGDKLCADAAVSWLCVMLLLGVKQLLRRAAHIGCVAKGN